MAALGGLGAVFDALADEAGEVTTEGSGEGHRYSRGPALFAVADEAGADLRLHPEVAEAASRTPDTKVSERGPGWIRFTPADLDGHAVDRARAWFLSAWRAAAQQG
jgi:hypothetical protein